MSGPGNSEEDPRDTLIEIARDFHRRGWMAGTAGNLSARAGPDAFWITASGRAKGRLVSDDFVLVGVDGCLRDAIRGRRPSAETSLHAVIYNLFPGAGACLHVHSVAACLAARTAGPAGLRLPTLEMIKAFDIWTEQPAIDLPTFANHTHVPKIADDLRSAFAARPPLLTAFLIRDHGTTVWGETVEQAYNRVEALEFLLDYLRASCPTARRFDFQG